MKMINISPDLGDLEEMLANVQTQIEHEIDLEKESKMPSLTNVQESPKMKRTSSFNYVDTEYRRGYPPKPPVMRYNSEYTNGTNYANDDYHTVEYCQPTVNSLHRGSQSSIKSDETASQASFQSFRSEPGQRHSVLSMGDKRGSTTSLNGRNKNATLPRGHGSSKEKNWEEYWSQ